ncbi:uncharacterized protein LOC119912200 isoform X2 [Micropterus salmoides]|uniref:uncharacterized protein LOC119912200 isoform X2 n=1 Tax=Micropterus salmoides TaxID=27706 RepID=UPI0018ECCA2F|nr:uncharacterized protein LOC119912200 isoform X2 [Micropterus salmoides]XP_038587197.1 uncharacterized protein LOC119912200 isoform X2 [Micropterus salmoides]
MRIEIILILFLEVTLVQSLSEVSGYVGENVTLPSGADPSWQLATIDWSVFPNNTWIATYRSGKENIERLHQYTGRLSLNISSGDLTIYNLTPEDAMEYTVDLLNSKAQDKVNKIKLTVRPSAEHLQRPTIQTVTSTSAEGGCWIGLHCSSTDQGVGFAWQINPPSVTVFRMSNPDGNSAALLAFLNTTHNPVQFTCTSSGQMESTSSVVTHNCDDDKPQPPEPKLLPQLRCRYVWVFFIGCFLGISLTAITFYIFKDKLACTQ